MQYQGTTIADALSVTEIYTVLRPDLVLHYPGTGERHPFPEIIYLSRGKHVISIDGKTHELGAGQMIIYAPESFHSSAGVRPSLADACILTFACDSPLLPPLYNRAIPLTGEQQRAIEAIVDAGVEYFDNRLPNDPTRGMVLREGVDAESLSRLRKQIELFLIDVAASAAHPKSKKEARRDKEFSEVLEFLQQNLSSPLTLARIALACSMSVSKLKLLFREKMGTGPIDCLIRLRIERAQALIRTEEYNLTEISERVGFSSLHYFSRSFKQITGVAPSEYAKLQKENSYADHR